MPAGRHTRCRTSFRNLYTKAQRSFPASSNTGAIFHHPRVLISHQVHDFTCASAMCFLGTCWRGARYIVNSFWSIIKSGFKNIYARVTRRRLTARAQLNEPIESVRHVVIRPAFNAMQKGALKRCIYKIQASDTSITNIQKLLERLEQEMDYKGNPANLRRLLHELGLYPMVSSNYKEYFLEKKKTRSMCLKYLQNVSEYREEGRPIIYTALSSVTLPRIQSLLDHRVVVAYAASEAGIIKDAITVFRYIMPIEQWYYMISYLRYEDWIRKYLIPNLPPNSVVVMRNTPWNKTVVKKSAMVTWLQERDIPFDSNATTSELRKLINLNKDRLERKIIEEILNDKNHTVLRLPPFHDDLNPLEMVWLRVEQYVGQANTRNNINQIVRLTYDGLSSIDGHQMAEYYHKACLIESGYRISEIHAETLSYRIAFAESLASSSSSIDLEATNNMPGDRDDEKEKTSAIATGDDN